MCECFINGTSAKARNHPFLFCYSLSRPRLVPAVYLCVHGLCLCLCLALTLSVCITICVCLSCLALTLSVCITICVSVCACMYILFSCLYCLRPSFLSLPVVTQIRGHILVAGSTPPSPLRFVPCSFVARRPLHFLPLVDSRRIRLKYNVSVYALCFVEIVCTSLDKYKGLLHSGQTIENLTTNLTA